MTLPPEKINELKQVIHSHLNQLDVHTQIRNVLNESMDEMKEKEFEKDDLLKILKERGIVEDIMKSLNFGNDAPKNEKTQHSKKQSWIPEDENKFPIDPGKRYLYLQIAGGKAFLEHLEKTDPYPGTPGPTFTIMCNFMGQRFHSKPVACACEPSFDEAFLLELKKDGNKGNKQPDVTSLLALSHKVHLVLIKTDKSGLQHLVASHHLEWRGILCSKNGRIRNAIELNGVGAESKVPVGVIDIRLDIVPKLSQVIMTDVVTKQLNLERSKVSERERLFLMYSKQWWREFLQIRSSHSNRLVKIFAQDENANHKLVCSYLNPMRSGRLIDTPREAARFVSLIPYEKHSSVTASQTDIWASTMAFLSAKKGDVEDHALLLCSLLLGFGLNAYVCIGMKSKSPTAHAWVVTIDMDNTVLFWESLTAQRYVHKSINPNDPPAAPLPPPLQHPYKTIGCLFNHESFYANCQPTDGVHVCSFDLRNEACWKSMSRDAIRSICGYTLNPPATPVVYLTPSRIDSIGKSNQVENDLRSLVFDHRQDMGLLTYWDDELSYLLSPALASYEFEQRVGVSIGNDDFQHAIRKHIPDGHTFKAFPIQFLHTNSRRAFATCLKSNICEQIICCRGDQVKHAVRVRVFTYPEDTCAVWIMFAVKYKSVL